MNKIKARKLVADDNQKRKRRKALRKKAKPVNNRVPVSHLRPAGKLVTLQELSKRRDLSPAFQLGHSTQRGRLLSVDSSGADVVYEIYQADGGVRKQKTWISASTRVYPLLPYKHKTRKHTK